MSELSLAEKWADFRKENPHVFARDAARSLGVTEVELVATNATRLEGDFADMVRAFATLGPVKTIVRNESAVLEKWGAFEAIDFGGHMGQVVGPIDLRIFLHAWSTALYVDETTARGRRRSVQVFDPSGASVLKVYLEEDSKGPELDAFVERFKGSDRPIAVAPPPEKVAETPDAEVDVTAFQQAWEAMQDTHEFFMLMRKFKLTRAQALRLAPPARVRPVATGSLRTVLESAAKTELPIMIFVGNRGIIQIHTGPVHKVKAMGPWFNVLDEETNLHVREASIVRAFVVEKPTKDGAVTALELYDQGDEMVAQFFGKRKPGQVEQPAWRELLAGLGP